MTATQVKGSRVSVAVGHLLAGGLGTLHHHSPTNGIGPLELDVCCWKQKQKQNGKKACEIKAEIDKY
jgi:hypothetical protein